MPTIRELIKQILSQVWSHPANRGRRVRASLRSIAWAINRRTLKSAWDVRMPGGLRIRCHPDNSYASLMVYYNCAPDWNEMLFMRRYLRPGDGFIDIGANIGAYTLLAGWLVGPNGRVDAFEPGPACVERLHENIRINALSCVHVHAAAVGASAGTVTLAQYPRDTRNRIRTTSDGDRHTIEVPSVRLDDALSGERFALAKVDVEGANMLVLEGARRMLAENNPPVWLLEMTDALAAYGHTKQGVADWMRAQGYDLAVYDPDRGTLDFQAEPWHKSLDAIAVARSRVDEVRHRLESSAG